jgi:hypothetical protein
MIVTLISQSVLISQFIKGQLAFVTRKNKYKGISGIAKKTIFISYLSLVLLLPRQSYLNLNLNLNRIGIRSVPLLNHLDQPFSKPKAIVTQEPKHGGIETLLFGNQLFGLYNVHKKPLKGR